ncbi:MAG: hypothetical protein PVH62_04650 [Anaerolineae bacterium]|jgi:hypothetical protein
MNLKRIVLPLSLLVLAALACNAPGAEPTQPPPTMTPFEPQQADTPTTTAPSPTEPPTAPLPTLTPKATPTPSSPPPATSPPVSAGPLDFPQPRWLDGWQQLPDGSHEVTIVVRISGGAPPFTVRHDVEEIQTSERDYPLVFIHHGGCRAINHSITVESADGQSVAHDYWIPAPWCITPSP